MMNVFGFALWSCRVNALFDREGRRKRGRGLGIGKDRRREERGVVLPFSHSVEGKPPARKEGESQEKSLLCE